MVMMSLRRLRAVLGTPEGLPFDSHSNPTWVFPDRGGAASDVGASIAGKRILVVEDEFLLADEVAEWLSDRGAHPLGPVGTLTAALELIGQTVPDAAVLDVRISGDVVFPAALELSRRGVPFIFATAFSDELTYPDEVADKIRLDKPFNETQLIEALHRALAAADD